jgi:ferredoxin-NADP reductase
MVDAAQEMLMRLGVDEARIHYDKFTTTANTEE